MLYIFGYMWFAFGLGAIIAAGFNIIWTVKGKDAKWFRFISLSLTALTLCAFHSQDAVWVLHKDWSALEDVVPAMSRGLWVLTLISIALNSISLFKPKNR
ncbi:MAG: hypothetical protein SOW50_08805 [Lachnospiraceae bacterium]|jgi:hypothetical protein|nr:hypothetical protein [Lachnospiraceae bacterium]